ncbi:hypothetical protein GVX82_00240 [Patescibacteria group bacterium]|jgi:pyruvate-formate lyase-activating enzyme|nr:hypothetical protein [Patescibacteria group bacterium]
MKFFATGRSNNYERVREVFERVKAAGHEVTFEWTTLPMVKPYHHNQEQAAEYAKRGIDGVVEADVYLLFAHEDGNGVYTELGAALASNAIQGTPEIYAIGEEAKWAAMFNYHPAIKWRGSAEEVLLEVNS